jgi:hypothetical protein
MYGPTGLNNLWCLECQHCKSKRVSQRKSMHLCKHPDFGEGKEIGYKPKTPEWCPVIEEILEKVSKLELYVKWKNS